MISRVLFRLAVAWLALLGVLYLYAHSINHGADFDWSNANMAYTLAAIPGALGLVLAWVFLPRHAGR